MTCLLHFLFFWVIIQNAKKSSIIYLSFSSRFWNRLFKANPFHLAPFILFYSKKKKRIFEEYWKKKSKKGTKKEWRTARKMIRVEKRVWNWVASWTAANSRSMWFNLCSRCFSMRSLCSFSFFGWKSSRSPTFC